MSSQIMSDCIGPVALGPLGAIARGFMHAKEPQDIVAKLYGAGRGCIKSTPPALRQERLSSTWGISWTQLSSRLQMMLTNLEDKEKGKAFSFQFFSCHMHN